MNHWACLKASCKVISLARKVPISWLPIYIQWLVQGFNRREKINAPSPTHLSTIGSIYINLSICPSIDQYSLFICVCSCALIALHFWMFEFSLLEVVCDCFKQNEISKRKKEFGMPWKVNFTKYIEIFHIKSTLMKERDLREGLQLNLRKNMKRWYYSYVLMWVGREDFVLVLVHIVIWILI